MLASFGSISLVFCFIAFVIFVFNALGKTFDSFVGTPRRKGREYTHEDHVKFCKEYNNKYNEPTNTEEERKADLKRFIVLSEKRKRQIQNGERITPV